MTDAEIDVELALWDTQQPPWERMDPLWSLVAYRLARYALDVVRADLRGAEGRITPSVRDQLLRATGSIAANIAEGYSRATARERARFYSFALGSTRESGAWYAAMMDELPSGVGTARIALLTRIRRLLLGLLKSAAQSPRFRRP